MAMRDLPAFSVPKPFRTAWARGSGSREIAEALGAGKATPVGRDWSATCIGERIDLLVTRRLPSFDLVSVAVPVDVSLERVGSVTAAIGGGPHSELAASVAAALAATIGVESSFVSVYIDESERPEVTERLQSLAALHDAANTVLLEASTAGAILDSLDESSLLVVGAPGGSWLQRQFFGPGHRLAVNAPGGAVVVRHAPPRAFHEMGECGLVFGPHMTAGAAARLVAHETTPVAEDGRLVGIVSSGALDVAEPTAEVAEVMDPPVSISVDEAVGALAELKASLDGAPVPVVDGDGRLIGCID